LFCSYVCISAGVAGGFLFFLGIFFGHWTIPIQDVGCVGWNEKQVYISRVTNAFLLGLDSLDTSGIFIWALVLGSLLQVQFDHVEVSQGRVFWI
jgi:hypothetical protein